MNQHRIMQTLTSPTPGQQRGVVLIMALVFLVIISLGGMYVMRRSIMGEQVSKNLRSNAVATQAAETALRYCEDEVRRGTMPNAQILDQPVTASAGALPDQWQTRANWFALGGGSDPFVELPAGLRVAISMRELPVPARCMVERFQLPPAPGEPREAIATLYLYQITAVGFSADYERDSSTNRAKSGGEAWLQSFLIL